VISAADVVGVIPPGVIDIGSKGFVALIILLILTGKLVPGKERDTWRDMALELKDQNSKLIAGAETTQKLIRSLPVREEPE
jgi:hypothetical protein